VYTYLAYVNILCMVVTSEDESKQAPLRIKTILRKIFISEHESNKYLSE